MTKDGRGGLNTAPSYRGQVAQLVEQRTENPRVGSSILPLATTLSPLIIGNVDRRIFRSPHGVRINIVQVQFDMLGPCRASAPVPAAPFAAVAWQPVIARRGLVGPGRKAPSDRRVVAAASRIRDLPCCRAILTALS